MMKVFLVDDEIAIRENLRNSFPWEEKGYQLVGEAPDGEMALPMLRDLNADILLTDIRMPFMDGMELCEEVQRTMPWVEMIILSGYDDFAYAQKAMSLGVREYLLKPVTADALEAALNRVSRQIEEKRREMDHLTAMRERISSGNQFLKDKLLASLFTEEGDPADDDALLNQMRGLGVNLAAGSYRVIDIAFDAEGEERQACRNSLFALAEMSGSGIFICSAPKGARALVLGDRPDDAEERAYSFANSVVHLPELQSAGHLLISVGDTVNDFHEIRQSMKTARHIRHLQVAEKPLDHRIIGKDEGKQSGIPLSETELSPLYERLQYASSDSVDQILKEYSESLDPALALGYLRVAALLTARRMIQDAGGNPKEELSDDQLSEALHAEGEEGFRQLSSLLGTAMAYRDQHKTGYSISSISKARAYLGEHFSNPNLMLQDAAREVHLSQSHFSTVFAQETGLTFTQYLTALRIGKAKELLEATEMRSSQIAVEVGYNDAHYFSYLFKKNTGLTPSEYRKNIRVEKK
ncbi:MAG: response regulator [Clostridia bacterium]|nr:response regulator [Clostridia bacterium]